jgi:dienelactone hydrolase
MACFKKAILRDQVFSGLYTRRGRSPFASQEAVASWAPMARMAGARADVFTYPNVGHFYTDATSPDYDRAATEKTWAQVQAFLDSIR